MASRTFAARMCLLLLLAAFVASQGTDGSELDSLSKKKKCHGKHCGKKNDPSPPPKKSPSPDGGHSSPPPKKSPSPDGGSPSPPSEESPPPKGGNPPAGGPKGNSCTLSKTGFWRKQFQAIVDGAIKNAPVGAATNLMLARKMKAQLTKAEGCGTVFEVLVWEGTHGHDHQGANVLNPKLYCDAGMYGKPPGDTCGIYGGTYHEFRTGGGKSFAVFINPAGTAGAVDKSVDVGRIVDKCSGSANLLIKWTACINKMDRNTVRLRGVIAIPTQGVLAPKGAGHGNEKEGDIRHNFWQTTFPCTQSYWIWCKQGNWKGRALTVFVVRPRLNRGNAY